ncbi:intraflagellar transport protein 88 homolog isoform X1 [Ixodes scapularis]|uniref:intraflagellar transport protein 88 homolog isoform X1 n=2 Tax=Ixodes scapularis TaxID=6945 RepID=UPI001C389D88|nr:intraflagellar transport protein 88 homolog isoform X1 [Ixodes scapularis]
MAVMSERVHLVPSDEDDLYSGYNEFNPSLDTNMLMQDEGFQQAVRTSYGRRPPTSSRFQAGMPSTSTGFRGQTAVMPPSRLHTSVGQPSTARPMTAVRGAGYSSAGVQGQLANTFDPLNQAKASTLTFQTKENASPEERLKQLETSIMELVEQSCFSASKKEFKLALDQAKDGVMKEKHLSRQREQLSAEIAPNLDLTYCVLFNLAVQYANNEMFAEALNTYQIIVKNKAFSNVGRLKLNMGNICFFQRNYTKAIKFYRMALDQVPNTHKDMRIKIMKNIGLAFVKMGQLADAITSLEYIMAERADFRSALHLIVCHYTIGDRDKMKRSFLKLLDVVLEHVDDEKGEPSSDDPIENLYYEEIKNDSLQQIERERRHEAEWCILTAAKLIAPVISTSFSEGYEWCVEQIKASAYSDIANDLEISKAVAYLRKREFNQAIETLKAFEKKDTKVASTAATNLSFLYFLQNDQALADKYADQAVAADRYNAGALVNKGNCCFASNDMERAIDYYREALATEASCVEALYNQGLAYQKLGTLEEALDCFYKLQAIIKPFPQVTYQIGYTYELMKDMDQALEWYQQLVTLVPTDPHLLAKIGELYDAQGDKQLAFQYHSDSYRYFPSNIEIIEWLGAYYIESQLFEKAIKYFEKAAIIQPAQVKWQLMVASCHRKSGNYQNALQTYKAVHRKFPDNIECLRFLVRLTTDLGMNEASEYAAKLKKAEKAKELKEHRSSSGSRSGSRRSSSRLSRDSSASSNASVPSEQAASKSPQSASRGRRHMPLVEAEETYQATPKEIDASYEDPLGPLEQRPRTAARRRDEVVDDEFDNEELGDDMLPE